MSYKVNTTATFRKEAKKLVKKYPSLKNELAELGKNLASDPTQGTSLGNNCYKIRLSIASKGKGKSGGGRVITHFYVAQQTVYLLSIFDKSEQETISVSEIKELLKLIQ